MLRTALHFSWRGMYRLARIALILAVIALLALRYWILPDIEHYHELITFSVSRALGQPLSIERIEADWQGFRPHLLLSNVRILDQRGETALNLQKVESEVAWTSLFTGEVRLYSLELDQPNLLIRRDAQGQLYVAGVLLSGASSGTGGPDWLLNQSRIVVRNASITWLDEQRAVPQLVFNEVNLLIDNGWRRHRFALRALPPRELSAQLDVRGEFYGTSFGELNAWEGQLFTQLDYADVAAWRTWLTLPIPLSRGKGALRGWLDIERGKIHAVTADLALSGVRTRLSEDLPPLDLRTLRGRVGWHDVARGIEIFTRNLSLRLSNGSTLPPTNFFLRYAAALDKQPASGEVRANELDMQGLSALSEFLPFDSSIKQKLAEFAPRGRVSDLYAKWQSDGGKLQHYELRARFDGLAARRVDNVPGFSGLTGEVDGSEASGTLVLNAHKLMVDAPSVMQESLLFDTLTAQVNWQSDRQGLEVNLGNVSVANADMKGNLYGSYHSAPKGPGVVDLTAQLTHAAVQHVDRYIPIHALRQDIHAWLDAALLGGRSDQVDLRLHGDLADFPFPGNKTGLFQIRARLKDADLKYSKDWPDIDKINGELLIEGVRLEVMASSATTVGNPLQKVSVILPDMSSPDMHLQIYGEVEDETAHALEYVRQSPVRGYIGGFTDNVTAHGNGMLNLTLDIPLRGGRPAKVNGTYRFLGDEVNLGRGVPVLQAASGDLIFTESGVHTQNMTAKILGGPATLDVWSGDGVVHANASGNTNLDAMRNASATPLLRYLHGGFPWEAQVTVQHKQAEVLVTSTLVGLSSSLPAPFAKRSSDAMPLRFERKALGEQQDMLSLQYGALLGAKFLRHSEEGEWKVKRGTVGFGSVAKWLDRDGVWMVGTIPLLSLEGWGALGGISKGTDNGESTWALDGADLRIQKVTAFSQAVNNLRVTAHSRNGSLFAQLASKDMNGDVIWQPQDMGALVVRLKNLALSGSENGKDEGGAGKTPPVVEAAGSGDSPEFHVAVDNLSYKGKPLGKLEMQAKQRAGNWLLERMMLSNPDGVLTADGKWLTAVPQTQVNLKLEISDAGKILSRYGYPNSVKDGGGKLEGAFSWRGGPGEFSYAALDGTLKLETHKGEFLKIDPGVGKLLGILSLQALPQHIKLDFTDVFSEGFAFDSITGTAQIGQGVLTTSDLKIDGPAAKATMTGQVDLARETQNLHVVVLPEVGGGVAVLGICVVNPAACVGTLIAKEVLKNPLEKLVSFEYNVTGTWANPNVVKLNKLGPKK